MRFLSGTYQNPDKTKAKSRNRTLRAHGHRLFRKAHENDLIDDLVAFATLLGIAAALLLILNGLG